MSAPPLSAIGEHVDSVSSWTPERDDPDGVFTYVVATADSLGMAKDVIVATSEAANRFGNLRPSLTYKIFREGVKLYGH